ncbi:hypothetical protein GIB67_018386 [Kingdonia uniflora]|uniref:X8 domain-containing protein n=1 Tax=Kingdonia uniflora TaxID=39325 RepID=A0A7J7MJ67_9MAGN|nr:hypothetical protein GIB67_018386 [Kingdonia uniflora]
MNSVVDKRLSYENGTSLVRFKVISTSRFIIFTQTSYQYQYRFVFQVGRTSIFISLFFLSLLTTCSSGTLVGFSYDARRHREISSTIETLSFLKQNQVSPSQIRVFVTDHHKGLGKVYEEGVSVDLYLNETDVANVRISKTSAVSWIKTHLVAYLPHMNVKSVVVGKSVEETQLPLLLSTLKLIHSALKSLDLEHQVKVSIEISLLVVEKLPARDLLQITNYINKCRSFIILESEISGELSMGDQFIESMIKSAKSAAVALSYSDVPIILNVKSSVAPSVIEVSEYEWKMMKSLQEQAQKTDRIFEILAEISPMKESEKKELNREEEQIFQSSRRELLNNFKKIATHDTVPTPTIVTVPSTNPVTTLPTNPATSPVTIPAATPIVTTPVIAPPTSITNPVTTPVTPPVTTPAAKPVTPPATTTTPTSTGQTWCVAKKEATESALQVALDYACGQGGADCSVLQPTGNCYNPNTQLNHASYAFNSYYQKNPVPTSCDFKGTAVIVDSNPSSAACVYPSSPPASSSVPTSSTSPPPLMTNTSFPSPSLPAPIIYSLPPPSIPSLPPPSIPSLPPPSFPSLPPPTTLTLPPPTSPSLPTVLNSSYPTPSLPTIFGSGPPPSTSTSESVASKLQPLFTSILLAMFIALRKLLLDL